MTTGTARCYEQGSGKIAATTTPRVIKARCMGFLAVLVVVRLVCTHTHTQTGEKLCGCAAVSGVCNDDGGGSIAVQYDSSMFGDSSTRARVFVRLTMWLDVVARVCNTSFVRRCDRAVTRCFRSKDNGTAVRQRYIQRIRRKQRESRAESRLRRINPAAVWCGCLMAALSIRVTVFGFAVNTTHTHIRQHRSHDEIT